MNALYPFQEETLAFLLSERHRLLADEPGVGKTPPTCVALKRMPKRFHKSLIICPGNIKPVWENKLIDWSGAKLEHIQILDTGNDIVRQDARWIIVSRELLYSQKILNQLYPRKYDACVVDEAHDFCNWDSLAANILFGHKNLMKRPLIASATNKWLLSGSFMPNRVAQMYVPLKCLAGDLLAPYETFEKFTRHYCNGYFDKLSLEWKYYGSSNLNELREKLRPFMLFRRLRDVYPDLPHESVDEVFCDLDIVESERDTPMIALEKIVGVAKIPHAVDFLRNELYNKDDKILAFIHNRKVAEELHKQLIGFDFHPRLYYGGMSHVDKKAAVNAFN